MAEALSSIRISEGQTFSLGADEADYLSRALGGHLQPRPGGYVIQHLAGHLRLPKRTLILESEKANGASLFSWMVFADPALRRMRVLGSASSSAQAGDASAIAARCFIDELAQALRRYGLLRIYRSEKHRTATIRGRIDFSELTRSGGNLGKTPCVVWHRLPDTPLNRFLCAAVGVVEADPILRSGNRSALASLPEVFVGVPPTIDPALERSSIRLARQELGFANALAWARLLISASGALEGQRLSGRSFIVNLDDLFEQAIVQSLKLAGIRHRPKRLLSYEAVAGERVESRSFQTDVFCHDPRFEPCVIDAKYKHTVSSSNLQQLVTYCTLAGVTKGVVAMPASASVEADHFRFTPAYGNPIEIAVVKFDTSGRSVEAWKHHAAGFVERLVGGWRQAA